MTRDSASNVPVDLPTLADELLAAAAGEHSKRAARTLPQHVEGLRQTVIALHDGAALAEHNSPGPAALLVLRGSVRLVAGDDTVSLGTHQYVAIPPRRHSLHTDGDAVVLLSVAVTVPVTAAVPPDDREAQG